MNTVITLAPPIAQFFDPKLLSYPTICYNVDYLIKIGDFIERKINESKFNRNVKTKRSLNQKILILKDLYERAKIEEGEAKKKTRLKTQMLGYRPRLPDKYEQRIFERLDGRSKTSNAKRSHSKVSKI